MQTADIGETIPLLSSWWDENGAGAEPSAITLTITEPDGTVVVKHKADMTSPQVAPAVLDTWVYPLVLSASGLWRYLYSGIVDGVVAEQSGRLLAGDAAGSIGPCEPWCTWADVELTCPSVDLSGLALGVREQLLDRATWILYSLDGSRYPGICEATRELCRSCVTYRRGGSCCCHARSSIDLGSRWPVYGVWDVTVAGVVLPPTAYQLRDGRYLERIDSGSWPACSDLVVSWAFGRRPPVGLRDATALFVAEMAKSCLGLKCQLPERVTSLSREGVNYVVLDSQAFLQEGRTGFYPVDLALIAAAAGRKASPGGFSPLRSTRASRVV